MHRSALLITVVLLAAGRSPAAGQDVEMLARHYGTPVPEAYYRTLARHPAAFQFRRGRSARMRARMREAAAAPRGANILAIIGPRQGPVVGTFRIPVVLGLFSDSNTPPYGVDTVTTAYFGNGPWTVTAFYEQVSDGRVKLTGDVMGWVRSNLTQAQATGGVSGLTSNTTPSFILDLLSRIHGVDWGRYDDDGPDGIPNSGDDDGYVDAIAVLQPTPGAECGGPDMDNRIWSHKWSLSSATGHTFTTKTPSANGGFIEIDDYFIQPIYACNGQDLDPIGVFSHETGHAFGLPDLYDTNGNGGQGDGAWDLMATGAWGCDNASPSRPCPMGAWSRAMLGWIDLKPLPKNTDLGTLLLPPVETGGEVYRADAEDGSGDYYLFENRERLGFDERIPGSGLLVWQIDPSWISTHWASNDVNSYGHLGVWVREADGENDLTRSGGNRGDAGDPFPYVSGADTNRVFHATSDPASVSHLGTPTGVTLLDITRTGQDVRFHALTRRTSITLRSEGDNGTPGLLAVNGSPVTSSDQAFTAAPFTIDTLAAAAGDSVAPGVRTPFVRWKDDPNASHVRTLLVPIVDSQFVAEYGGRQVHLAIDATGGVDGVDPGSFSSDPPSDSLWFAPGTDVQVLASPRRGFSFVSWTDALAGQGNPAHVTMDAPMRAGAVFKAIYGVSAATYDLQGGEPADDVRLQVENGSDPVRWMLVSGTLPYGLMLNQDGTFAGGPLDLGTFQVEVRAVDALGLSAVGAVTLDVSRPSLTVDRTAEPFLDSGTPPTELERAYLDRQGNRNGTYDLGDFRAWVLSNQDVAAAARSRAAIRKSARASRRLGGAP